MKEEEKKKEDKRRDEQMMEEQDGFSKGTATNRFHKVDGISKMLHKKVKKDQEVKHAVKPEKRKGEYEERIKNREKESPEKS